MTITCSVTKKGKSLVYSGQCPICGRVSILLLGKVIEMTVCEHYKGFVNSTDKFMIFEKNMIK